ncbi:MAG: DUF3800 domain-containing protein [Chloroflexota bacterium]|nr:DUF3800 domain-containing protein [Chloroflexota bacterium]
MTDPNVGAWYNGPVTRVDRYVASCVGAIGMGPDDQDMDEGAGVEPPPHPPGDPKGRRLARRRSALLAEASGVARLLDVLLNRADEPREEVGQIVKDLGRLERIALQDAHGRVEPRTRFKRSEPTPLVRQRNRNLLFIDESGQSGPVGSKGQRVFALAGIAMDEEAVDNYTVAANEIKLHFFETTDVTFHEPEMRLGKGRYEFGHDSDRQRAFERSISGLIEQTPFTAFGIAVRKDRFLSEYVDPGTDPYLPTDVYAVAIVMLLERYLDFLSSRSPSRLARVTFESQEARQDAYHQLEYARALMDGSQWVAGSSFRNWLEPGLRFTTKSGSDPMELADMFARDLFEWVRGDCVEDSRPRYWDQFSKKVHCRGDGRMGKFGVKVFPDHDIRERIDAHRRHCGAAIGPQNVD